MTDEQYKQASNIEHQLRGIQKELKVWEEVTYPHYLGYKQLWNGDHFAELPRSCVPDEAFHAYRLARINELKVSEAKLKDQFSKL